MRKATTKADVFSFGIIVMELITRRRPTGLTDEDGSPITLSQFVHRGLQNEINGLQCILDPHLCDSKNEEVLKGLLHLALSCSDPDPLNRPDMDVVVTSLSKIRKIA